MSRPRIAVVVPAFNEAASLPGVLAALRAVRQAQAEVDWLIIVVNDGSTDRTAEVLADVDRAGDVRVVDLPINVGIGAAVQAGFQLAVTWNADVTLQFDGDGQHPAEALAELVEPVLAGRADVVVGSRYLRGSGGAVSGRWRQLGTRLFSGLLRLLVGVRIQDCTSGFRAFSRDASEFISRYYPDDYPEVEAYVPLVRRRFRIVEIPVHMKRRAGGDSSITVLRGLYYMLKVTLAVLIHLIKPLPPRRRDSHDA